MEVTLNLFATLSRYMPKKAKGNPCTIELDEGTRVRDLLEGLKIPGKKVKFRTPDMHQFQMQHEELRIPFSKKSEGSKMLLRS